MQRLNLKDLQDELADKIFNYKINFIYPLHIKIKYTMFAVQKRNRHIPKTQD